MPPDRDPVLQRRARPPARAAAAPGCPACGAPLPASPSARGSDGAHTVFAVASAFLAGAAVMFLFVSVRGPARVVNPGTAPRAMATDDASRAAATTAAETEQGVGADTRADAGARAETPSTPAPAAGDGPVVAARRSASRGQRDWRFFFGIGDALTRMRDGALLGTVIRLEKWYGFPDGTQGPAYILRSPDGEAVFDADELERGARIQ